MHAVGGRKSGRFRFMKSATLAAMRRCMLLAWLLTLASCAAHEPVLIQQRSMTRTPPREIGDRTEVHTAAGPRPGYVVRTCRRDDAILGVDCLGTTKAHGQTELAALHAELEALMKPTSVGVGFGLGCDESDRGFRVYVNRYAEVDAVAERAGALCVERNLRARFSIHLVIDEVLL